MQLRDPFCVHIFWLLIRRQDTVSGSAAKFAVSSTYTGWSFVLLSPNTG